MVLHLVRNDSKQYDKDVITCQTHCELFDKKTGKCGYYNNNVPYDPYFTAKCSSFLSTEAWESFSKEVLQEFEDHYPNKPAINISSKFSNAIWYVSPDKNFGCWIISNNKKRLMSLNNNKVIQRRGDNCYKSPYPLHDHGYGDTRGANIAWIIDTQGFGEYAMIIDDEIIFLNSN